MSAVMQGTVAEALAGLVNQFADPMACFRELVQNAVDAGSSEVDIRFEHVDGRLVIHVDDYGEGMDRSIIDTRLTRLFSSSKEGDRTKIGRFGIGFVSVFALQPEVICLDTSRAGEHWRVIFLPDRSFRRVARDSPVDGTKIAIYRTMPAEEAQQFAARARAVIEHWCCHVPADVRIDGVSISRPFALDLPCVAESEAGETRILAGYDDAMAGSIGYYNRGLTLLVERPGPFPGVHVKLWSPTLEHTMTRDNVLRDDGHTRGLELARALVEGPLRARLIAVLATMAKAIELHRGGELADRLMAHLLRHVLEDEALPDEAWSAPLVRCHHAGAVDLGALRRAAKAGRVYWAELPSPLTRALHERGDLVIAAQEEASGGSPASVTSLPRALSGRTAPALNGALCTSLPAPEPAGWGSLRAALASLLAELGTQPRSIALGDLRYPGSQVSGRVAIAQDEPGDVTALDRLAIDPGRRLVLNAGHPAVAPALALAAREPEFAAHLLAKQIQLERGGGLAIEHENRAAARAMELRCRRTS